MKFDRTITTLNILNKKHDITILDTINIFFDICEDIRAEDKSIATLQTGEIKDFIIKLSWFGQTFLQIQKINRDKIYGLPEMAEMFHSIRSEIECTEKKLSEVENSIIKNNKIEEQLTQKLQELKNAKEKENETLQKCDTIKNSIAEYEKIHIPDLDNKLVEYSKKLINLKEEYDKKRVQLVELEQKMNFLKDNISIQNKEIYNKEQELSKNSVALSTLRGKSSLLENKINEVNSAYNRVNSELQNKKNEFNKINSLIQDTETQINELINIKIPNIQSEYNQAEITLKNQTDIYNEQLNKLQNLNDNIQKLDTEKQLLDNEVADKEIKVADIEKKISNLQCDKAIIDDKIEKLGIEKKNLINEIQIKREQLNNSNVPTLSEKLRETQNNIEQMQKQSALLQQEIDSKSNDFNNLQSKFNEKNESYNKLVLELQNLNDIIKQYDEKQDYLVKQKEIKQREKDDWINWYNQTGKKYQCDIDNLNKSINILTDASEKLCNSGELTELLKQNSAEKFNLFKQCYKDRISAIEKSLKEYQNSYNIIVSIIESECGNL